MFACLRIEINVPVAISGWFGTVTSRRVSGCRRWIWLPVYRTGLKPKMARILIISRDDSRGIFDKIIHFNVQVGQLMVSGCQLD